ncbi:hypothetical protein BKA62DRAFT_719634 [Auriculariales sp. MPI-PUGE-AT-0066]|nr:hypothetical protein BKA62DRAFT_719634 [Auriculariales sp. MPI-PUGE-AT-0066]
MYFFRILGAAMSVLCSRSRLAYGLCLNSATSPSVLSAAVANLTHIITSGTSQVKKVASSSRSCGCASSSTAISKEVASLIADVSKILVDVHDIIDQQCTNSQELWSSLDNSIYGLLRCLDGLVGGVIAKVSKILKNITATLNILRLTKTLSCLGLTVSSILGTVPKIIGAL